VTAGAFDQLAALVGLRWRMVRSARTRAGLSLLAVGLVLLLGLAYLVGQYSPHAAAFNIALVTPTALLAFAVLATAAPLVAGGGNELFPADQLTPVPVRPAARYLGLLLTAPLNVAWVAQVAALCWLAGFVTRRGPGGLLALLTVLVYAAFATALGQAAAWLVLAVRMHRAGRLVTWGLLLGLVALVSWIAAEHLQYRVLDRAPTLRVLLAMLDVSAGRYRLWAVTVAVLLAGGAVAVLVGVRLYGWAERVPDDRAGRREGGQVARRSADFGLFRELLAVDRASVWRSAPLRRGLVTLTVLPGLIAAAAGLSYRSLVILPALVAPTGGLLFGVNLFCLDGSGAVWLLSQPLPARQAISAKVWVLTETCLGTVLLAVGLACLRAPHPPTAAQLTALVASVLVCSLEVVAICLHLSVHRPHRADLRGRRDTPVPPAAMAAYSCLMAVVTTVTGVVLSWSTLSGSWTGPVLVAMPPGCLAGWVLTRSVRRWSDPVRRSAVAVTVSYG
jgi:hypothetical protein